MELGVEIRWPENALLDEAGWPITPKAHLGIVQEARTQVDLPLIITSVGIADSTGVVQQRFLEESLHSLETELTPGSRLEGAFFRSLFPQPNAEGQPQAGLISCRAPLAPVDWGCRETAAFEFLKETYRRRLNP